MLQKSSYHAPIMLRAVTLCPGIILRLNAQLEYLIALIYVLLECLALVVTALLEYISQLVKKLAYCYDFCFFK